MASKSVSESTITRNALQWLNSLEDTWAEKYPAGPHGKKGVADIFGATMGVAFVIEMKQPGEKATPSQESFLDRVSKKGSISAVCDSVDGVKQVVAMIRDGEELVQLALQTGGMDKLKAEVDETAIRIARENPNAVSAAFDHCPDPSHEQPCGCPDCTEEVSSTSSEEGLKALLEKCACDNKPCDADTCVRCARNTFGQAINYPQNASEDALCPNDGDVCNEEACATCPRSK